MSEWREITLGECFDLSKAKIAPNDVHAGVPYVGMEHLDPGSPRVARWGSPADVTSLVSQFESGDVLFGRLRPYLRKVALADQHGVCSPEILVLRPTEATVPGFTYLLASSDGCIEHAVAQSAGSRMPRASATDLAAHPISVPPLDEQRRIVDVVAAVDAQIEALKSDFESALELVAAARRLLASSDEVDLLSSLADDTGIQIGPFGSQLHAREYSDEGTPVVMPQDIVNGEIVTAKIKRVDSAITDRLTKHRLTSGDIVFPRRGDLTKRALVQAHQEGWLCGTGCLRFRPADSTQAARLFEALSGDAISEWLVENAVGTTMLNLNTTILSKIPVPSLSAFADLADANIALGGQNKKAARELARLRAFRSTLLTALLSQSISIPESYDSLLDADPSVLEGAPA